MASFCIANKMLILKILLASLITLSAGYEFGYHPSAEEFDNFLRETAAQRTWTRDLLASEHRRSWTVQNRDSRGRFVPKFKYENQRRKFDHIQQATHKPANDRNDGFYEPHKLTNPSIASTLDFQMFSDEVQVPSNFNSIEDNSPLTLNSQTNSLKEPQRPHNKPNYISHSVTNDLTNSLQPSQNPHDIPQSIYSGSSGPSSATSQRPLSAPQNTQIAQPHTSQTQSNLNNVNFLPGNYQSANGNVSFPIFFTNPASGIVYAITEIGKSPNNNTQKYNSTNIPIYITKEQYDRDIYLTRKYYSSNCNKGSKPFTEKPPLTTTTTASSVLSSPSKATLRPQIIKLQRPSASTFNSKPSKAKQPGKIIKPPPVMLQSNYTINNQMHLPTARPTKPQKTRTKTKKKKSRRPGLKPSNSLKTKTTQASLPLIVLGKPNQTTLRSTHATQVERPQKATITTITFSQKPITKLKGNLQSPLSHRKLAKKVRKENKMLEEGEARIVHETSEANYNEDNENPTGNPTTVTDMSEEMANESTAQEMGEEPAASEESSTAELTAELTSEEATTLSSAEIEESTTESSATYTMQHTTMKPPKYRIRRDTSQMNDKISADLPTYRNKLLEDSFEVPTSSIRIKLIPKEQPFQNSPQTAAAKRNRYRVKSKTKLKPKRTPTNPTRISINNKQKNNQTRLWLPASVLLAKSNSSTHHNASMQLPTGVNSTQIQAARKVGTTPRQRKNSKRKNDLEDDDESAEGGFNFFDLLGGDTDDDEEYDDYYDDEDDGGKIGVAVIKRKAEKLKKKLQKKTTSTRRPSTQDYSLESLKEPKPDDNGSSAEPEADFGALEEDYSQTAEYLDSFHHNNEPAANVSSLTKANTIKKRIRRRPASTNGESTSASYEDDYGEVDIVEDEDDDDDDDGGGSSVGSFFRMVFYPVQVAMSRIMDNFDSPEAEADETLQNPTYTMYNSAYKVDNSFDYADEDGDSSFSLGNWLGSWFGYARKTKKIGSTTVAPIAPPPKPTEAPGWFDSWWFGGGGGTKDTAEENEEESWFSGWFDSTPKSKAKRRTTTTTTTPTPQVPILTIVDPLKNPQNWIGILAHHIINSTTTSTQKPLLNAINKATATTTPNPDIPRHINYDKYQIWRLKPENDYQVKALEDLKQSEDGIKLQWLKGPSLRGLTDVLVPPKMFVDLQGSLSFESIAHEVLIFDVGKAIAYEKYKAPLTLAQAQGNTNNKKGQKFQQQQQQKRNPLSLSWHQYHEFDDIITHLEALRMRYTQLVELIHIGRSYEGRPLVVVKLEVKSLDRNSDNNDEEGRKSNNASKRPKHKKKTGHANAVFIEAGTHGLEWIGPATATWMINELLRIMRSNKTSPEQNFIKQTTWYIMPVLNPDGYVYSHEYDRFWKKSRSRHIAQQPNGILNTAMSWLQQSNKKKNRRVCYGVDLDRNWRYQWGKRGSSKSACNEFYAGPTAFSEPETKALADFLVEQRSEIKLFISMQSYGQLISFPYKANSTIASERMDDLLDVAMVGTDGLRRNGSKTRYRIDSSNDLIERRSGCSDAFAAYELGVPYSYTLQLADNGVHGYLLPSTSIISTARDAFEIVSAMLDYI